MVGEHNLPTIYPLHLACINGDCPNAVIELLVKENNSALSHQCVIGKGAEWGHYDSGYVTGIDGGASSRKWPVDSRPEFSKVLFLFFRS